MNKNFITYLSIGFSLRLIIVILSNYFPLIGMDSDAIGFFEKATNFNWASMDLFESDSNIFVIWNYLLFSLLGNFIIVGQFFCIISWALSFYVFYLIFLKLNISKDNYSAMFKIYCFLPSSLIFTSAFLRESYQLLFVNLSVLFFLKLSKSRYFLLNFILLNICVLILFFLHNVYIILPLGFVLIVIYKYLINSFKRKYINLLASFIVILILVFGSQSDLFRSVIELHSIGIELSGESRANYVNFENTFNPILRLFQFLFEPFPWRAIQLVDLFGLIENSLIFYILVKIFTGKMKSDYVFIFLFILISFSWSLFTYNWGTSIRHHLPQLGLILIAYSQSFQYRKQ